MKAGSATGAISKSPRPRRIEWSDEELQLLHEHYPAMKVQAIQMRYLPERTVAAIKLRAKRERIRGQKSWSHWTAAENAILREHYLTLSKKEFQQRHLPHRTLPAIVRQALLLGLRRPPPPPRRWTAEERDLVRSEWHSPGGREYLVQKLGMPAHRIAAQATALGLRRIRGDRWTPDEEACVRQWYPSLGARLELLLERSRYAIELRARALGVRYSGERLRRWRSIL